MATVLAIVLALFSAVPAAPQEVLIRPDGKIAYVSCNTSGKVAAIDLAQWKVQNLIAAGNFADGLAQLGPHTAHLHFGDAKGLDGEGLQVGEGEIDFDEIGAVLRQHAPGASFIPEIWQGHKNMGEGFWTALERLEGRI